jgi:hypothetical protein
MSRCFDVRACLVHAIALPYQNIGNYWLAKILVRGACLVGAQICPTNFLAAYNILVFVWLVAKILVAYGILPTLLTLTFSLVSICFR